jgi:ACR3 family arsenite efflux pump ArsB
VLPLNLILQVILLPVFLLLFFGASGSVNPAFLFESIGLVLIVPFVAAQVTKYLLHRFKQSVFLETCSYSADPPNDIFRHKFPGESLYKLSAPF